MNSQDKEFEDFTNPLSNSSETLEKGEVRRGEHGRLLPGSKLNPSGPKKGYRQFKTVFMEKLMEEVKLKVPGGGTKTVEAMEAMAQAMINKAISGDVYAFTAVSDRVDGKPAQNGVVKHEGNITYEIVEYRDLAKKPKNR